MRTPKTLKIVECRLCGGSTYGGETKLVLNPGTMTELPDEIAIILHKVSRCTSCKQVENRTTGGKRKRFER